MGTRAGLDAVEYRKKLSSWRIEHGLSLYRILENEKNNFLKKSRTE
jgi:hypothetical protein